MSQSIIDLSRRAFIGGAAALGATSLIIPEFAFAETAAEKQAEADAVRNQLVGLQADLETAGENYYAALDEQESAQRSMEEQQVKIDETTEEIEGLQDRLSTRARSMYRSGSTTFIDFLLGASSFAEFTQNWELLNQITPIVERSRKITRYYSERKAENRVTLSIAAQRYPFCAKAFVEFLHLLDEPHIQVSFKEMEMAAVIDEVTARRSAFGIIFVSDMTEHFIGRILREKNLTFQPLVDIRPRVFLRKGHPLSGERAVRLEQLYAYPYAVFTQSDSNYHFAEEAVVGTGAEFDRVVSVSDRATAYNVIAHTDCVSTGSGVLPDGYGDDRLMTLPLTGDIHDMRLGVIRPKDVPLTPHGQQFVDILKRTLSDLAPSD